MKKVTQTLALSILVVAICSGCVSLNLFGGRTIMNVNVNGERSDNDNNMEADSNFEDALKDILDTSPVVPPVVLPGNPPVTPRPTPTPTPVPPAPFPDKPTPEPGPNPGDSVKVDGEWIPKPDDPNARLGKGTPGWMERNQALWKAKSEHGGLVVLLPMMQRPKEAIIYAVSPDHSSVKELERSKKITRSGHNGNRAHIRWGKQGGAYQRGGHATHIKVYMQDGTTLWYHVPKPSARHEMEVSDHQDKNPWKPK